MNVQIFKKYIKEKILGLLFERRQIWNILNGYIKKKLLLKNYRRITDYMLPYNHEMLFSSMIISHMPQVCTIAIWKFHEIIANNNEYNN